ncbi:uncharacterized protein [Rutidosis leptorrhynchoides]|uniref:uncharacterized protein n=1 Tax=Rutidosis leptorrhynchoides TaxID=125765 RepID=UPI003A98CEC3
MSEEGVTAISNLDFGDPLYLHASDISSTPLITIKLRGTENYKVWCSAMTLALQTKNTWGFIDKTCIKDTEDEVLGKQWDRCNAVVLTWILGCISEELYLGQVFSKNASDVWQELKETYDKVDKSFDALTCLTLCYCDKSKGVIEHVNMLKLMQFLMGLDEVYAPIRRKNHIGGLGNKPSTGSSSFVSQFQGNSNRRFNNNRGPNPNLKCTHCDFKKRNNNFNQGSRNKGKINSNNSTVTNSADHCSSSGSSSFPFSHEKIQKLMSLINEPSVQSGSGNFKNNAAGLTVAHPNGTQAIVYKIGNYKLSDKVVLKNVLVVPQYCVNLLSVYKLVEDANLFVRFDNKKCYIQDLGKETVETGSQIWGLYYFDNSDKTEVFENVAEFYNLILNQFNVSIKVLRSDNETEFTNWRMNGFVKNKGIIHQTSCPYTPQQNGVVERKHRHMLNVARSLMFQGGLPLYLWSECVLTACYLINRLPTVVLDGMCPYELVFNCEPNLSHIKTFGCLCFSNILNEKDKFESRSEKCV